MKYIYSYCSDKGIVKPTNQDALLIKEGRVGENHFLLFAVCDGMGGYAKGEVASSYVIKSLAKWFDKYMVPLWEQAKYGNMAAAMQNELTSMIGRLSNEINEYGSKQGIRLGTTASIMIIINDVYYIIHVGDSRIYKIADVLSICTEDHSLVAREVACGRLAEEEMEKDSRRNILLQSIGGVNELVPQFLTGKVSVNTSYLLCSDGFRHVLEKKELYESFHPYNIVSTENLKAKCEELVELVKERKEQDNISVIAVKVFE